MVTSSYPRFPGDSIATFMEPIARGVAARGHEVHVVAPWHPQWRRAASEGDVHFHLFRYAPVPSLNVFGYAAALRADVRLRVSAIAVAPLALVAGWQRTRQVARDTRASIVHAHWVIPSGVMGAAAAGRRPLVISLHGSGRLRRRASRPRPAGRARRVPARRLGDGVQRGFAESRRRAGRAARADDRGAVRRGQRAVQARSTCPSARAGDARRR